MLYLSSVSFTTFVSIAAGFIVLRWVGPEEMGVWQLLIIINTYAIIGGLGLNAGLAREFPFLLGKGDEKKALDYTATVKTYSFMLMLFTLVVMLVFLTYFIIKGKDEVFILTFITIMLMLAINFYKEFILTLFRTNKAFVTLSKSLLIQGILSILLLPMIFVFKYKGYLAYNLLNAAISLVLLYFINPIKVKFSFDKKGFLEILKTGLPLFLLAYLYGVSKTFIKFAVLHYGGVLLLGLFAPVFAIRNSIAILPKSISQYIYPKFTFKIGATNDPSLLWSPVKNISFLLLGVFTVLALPIYFFMPDLLLIFFPKYVSVVFPARMAVLSGVIYSSFIGITSLNSIKGYRERIIISTLYITFSAILPFLLPLFFQDKMEGIAWAILCIDVLYFIVAFVITRNKLLKS